MNSISDIINKGVNITLDGDDLNISAPKGTVTPEILAYLRDNKSDIVELLSAKIPKASLADSYSLSSSQKRFWILSQFEGGSSAYNIPFYFQTKVKIRVDKLKQALVRMVDRHPILRTVFQENEDGEVRQIILSDPPEVQVEVRSWSDVYGRKDFILEMNKKSFDLSQFPIFYVAIFEQAYGDSLIHLSIHHIISDEWSLQLFFNELIRIYDALLQDEIADLPDLDLDFIDYTQWLKHQLETGRLDASEQYWLKQFSREITDLQLPVSNPRPLVKTFNGESVRKMFNNQICQKLRSFVKKNETTLFTTLFTALNAILYRYSSQNDIVIGIPVSGRDRAETKDVMGLFINSLPILTHIHEDDSFHSLLKKGKQILSDAYQHQQYPFDLIIEKLKVNRDPGRSPLFDIMITLSTVEQTSNDPIPLVRDFDILENSITNSQFDIVFRIVQKTDDILINVEYNTDIFNSSFIHNLFQHLENFLDKSLDSPDIAVNEIDYLSATERHRILHEFNQTKKDYPDHHTIIDFIENQAIDIPNEIAVVYCNRPTVLSHIKDVEIKRLSYNDLSKKSNQFAHFLATKGIDKGDYVGLLLEKSEWMIIALLGILKARGVYVPIDPDYPEERREYFKTISDCKLFIDHDLMDEFHSNHENYSELSTAIKPNPDDPFHVMFTSGSTGIPKGVVLTHRNIVGLISPCSYMDLNRMTVLLSTVSVSFDTTNVEFWGVLANGGKVILERKEYLLDAEILRNTIIDHEVNTMWLTCSWFESVAENNIEIFGYLKQFLTGGDVVSSMHVNLLRNKYPDLKIINGYGPTEDTTFSTTFLVEKEYQQAIPIGKPIDNGAAYILNNGLLPQPVGVIGTIFLGGIGVAQGYFKNEELTKERFIKNPFIDGGRLYNTGDLGRWLPDGNIDFVGRLTRQVKIHGKIIDTTEIENALNKFSEINQSIVTVQETGRGKKIIAYIVTNGVVDHQQLKADLKESLALFQIPFLFVEISEMPLTPNGKADRMALPEIGDLVWKREIVPPSSDIESDLIMIWKQILKIEEIGITDNFFDLGGHSLLATRVISQVRSKLNSTLLISELFLNPTVAELAKLLILKEEKRELLNLSMIHPEERILYTPLSFAQERLWFIDQMNGSLNYHVPYVFRLKGVLNLDALEDAFRGIMERHEIMRSGYDVFNGVPYQFTRNADGWKMRTSALADEDDLKELIREEIVKPFDLAKDDLIRLTLLGNKCTGEHILILIIHHIVSDGWSVPIIMKELATFYNAHQRNIKADLPALPIQYADYAIWQRKNTNLFLPENELDYWTKKLAGVTPLNLPLDFKRPKIREVSGRTRDYKISGSLRKKLNQLSQEQDTTLFMTMLSVFNLLLYRYSGQDDICIGIPVANRTRKEIEPLIGFFVNTLVIRTNLEGNPDFTDLLRQVKTTALEAYDYQNMPFEKILEKLNLVRDLSQSPVFQVLFNFHNNEQVKDIRLDGLMITAEPFKFNFSKFDLSVDVSESKDGINLSLVYGEALFTETTIDRLFTHYEQLLNEVVNDRYKGVNSFNMLSAGEVDELNLFQIGKSVSHPQNKTLIDLIEESVKANSKNIALTYGNEKITFAQLDNMANQLACHLQLQRIDHTTLVGIQIENPIAFISAIIAVFKLGAAYLPIDPGCPENKIKYIMADSKLNYILRDSASDHNGFEDSSLLQVITCSVIEMKNNSGSVRVSAQRAISDLAYVIYTSGSTGNPKGVMVNQKNLMDYFYGLFDHSHIAEMQSFALCSTLSADLGNTILFSSLILGGNLHLFDKDYLRDGEAMYAYLQENQIDCLKMVPSHWRGLSYKRPLLPGKMIIFGGEEFGLDIVDKIKESGAKLWVYNHYGPTETTIGKLIHLIDLSLNNQNVPLGKPFSNNRVYILDSLGNPCPIGIKGEICIAGEGVSSGYLNHKELTNEKFVSNAKLSENNLYKTGDLGYRRLDGAIVYAGRIDDQVKIRGHRIEPGEIQKSMLDYDKIREAYVTTQADEQGQPILVAYIVTSSGFDMQDFRVYLKSNLIEVFTPAYILPLKELPLNSNGKIDRMKLPDISDCDVAKRGATPVNEVESTLCTIWQNLLSRKHIGTSDNFFELGGHSLLVTRMLSEIRDQLKKEVSIREIFMFPTIAGLADILKKRKEIIKLPDLNKAAPLEEYPLSFAQERLWFLDQLQGSVNYHIPIVFKWNDAIDCDHLQTAFRQLMDRHAILRSIFPDRNGLPYLMILPSWKWELQQISLQDESLEDLVQEIIMRPFQLAKDFLVRVSVIRVSENENIVVIVKHHIVSDGWSRTIFMNELITLFEAAKSNRLPRLKTLPLQYHDFILWQRRSLTKEMDSSLFYWAEKLKDVEVLQLPYDFVRPFIQRNRGKKVYYSLNDQLVNGLRQEILQERVSLFMYLISAFNVLLYKYTGQNDICIGTPIANRTQKEIENLIGLFVNTLAIRNTINAEQSFSSLLQEVKETCLEAYEHQHLPFERVVQHLPRNIDTSRNPIFDVMFSVNNYELYEGEILTNENLEFFGYEHQSAQFDLNFNVNESRSGILLEVEYCTDLFREESIMRLLSHYEELLTTLIKQPTQSISELSMLPEKERKLILGEIATIDGKYFNTGYIDLKNDKPLNVCFEVIASDFKMLPAVIHNDVTWDYHQLNEYANQIGHQLIDMGVEAGTCVGLFMERSPQFIGSLLGILKAGAIYVPLDTNNPAYRVRKVIENHQLTVLITDVENLDKLLTASALKIIVNGFIKEEMSNLITRDNDLEIFDLTIIERRSKIDLQNVNEMDSWAYVLFTSGSTGEPKGAITRHNGAINHILAEYEMLGLQQGFRFLQSANIGSDVSVWQMLAPLIKGGTVVIIDKMDLLDYEKTLKIIDEKEVSLVEFVPGYLFGLLHYLDDLKYIPALDKLTHLLLTGEDAPVTLVNALRKTLPQVRLFNLYGPCETSDDIAQFEIIEQLDINTPRVPIGTPVMNMNIVILDQNLKLSPIGVPGELYTTGIGVGAGYLGDDEKTKQSFIPNIFPGLIGDTLYKTGDSARWLTDGNIEFLGRKDSQKKIRGNRVELGEIASFILLQEEVSECYLLIHKTDDRQELLIAFIVLENEGENYLKHIKIACKASLPAYMMPGHFMCLAALPTNLSGKTDHKKLLEVFQENYRLGNTEEKEDLNSTEQILLDIWKEELKLPDISKYDDFFQIGGHSLLATLVIFRIRKTFNINLPLITLFKYNKILELAEYIDFFIDDIELADEDAEIIEI